LNPKVGRKKILKTRRRDKNIFARRRCNDVLVKLFVCNLWDTLYPEVTIVVSIIIYYSVKASGL
jgi:hypothetical protein